MLQRSNKLCSSCGSSGLLVFYQIESVPAHSVLLLRTLKEALNYPRGNITLALCPACGFVSNTAFDASLHEYSGQYEATQGYSPTFNVFHQKLANHLIERYDLHNKEIVEIGCGNGEFLTLLCEMGNNRGVGFDPAYVHGRMATKADLTFIKDFYSEKYSRYSADFICCKMTLEHIPNTAEFVSTVYRSVTGDRNTTVFFQVPNARYVFGDVAFWDVYYEHCSYFTLGSMARLFRGVGFEVIDLWTDYDDQYLMIEARPGNGHPNQPLPQEEHPDDVARDVAHFSRESQRKIAKWKRDIRARREMGQRVVLWGGGSKGVSFLTTLGLTTAEVEFAVDINPHKAGTFMAGTGQEIVPPDFLQAYRPDVVIIMNPIYRNEIERDLKRMNLEPEVLTV